MPPKKQGILKFKTEKGMIRIPIERAVFTIGRAPSSDIPLANDSGISRHHCRITAKDGDYFLKDLKSRNGTFVNGEAIQKHKLEEGDTIVIGGQEIVFERDYHREELEQKLIGKVVFCSKCHGSIRKSEIIQGISTHSGKKYICSECSDSSPLKKKTFNNYLILGKIAQGGFGVVYKVRHRKTGITAALKIIREDRDADGETVNRFMREVRLGSHVSHPNIVRFIEAGEKDDLRYLIMEYCDGKSIADIILEKGDMLAELPEVAGQLFSALKVLHEHDIIHRDVKPDNILVTENLEVKLIDFGLVKNLRHSTSLAITRRGEGVGTLHYIPAEQLKGAKEIDQRADIYGLGATFYEMACGQPPVTGEGFAELVKAITSGKKTHLCDINPLIPRKLGNCIMKAVNVKPTHRFRNIIEFKEAFFNALNQA